ncbi:peptidase C11 [Bacteroidia bacterium]|nr:peptidase C11 [Bacteroidia bacterium]
MTIMIGTRIIATKWESEARFLLCLAFVFIVLSLSSCERDEIEESLPIRTVIVYMVADNNLDNFALKDINEMEQGWQDDLNGNLIVYVDRAEGASPSHPVVYKIGSDTTSNVVSPIVKVYPEQNSTDKDVMFRVLSDIIVDYPAQSYGLVLWSHGSAWFPSGTNINNIGLRSFGRDGVDEMNIFDLKNAMPRHFDFIAFDACYMGAIEVIYELRNQTDYIIASATEILSAGYPYQQIVKQLFSHSIDYSKVANTFLQSYAELEGAMRSASIAVVKTLELNNLATKFSQIMVDTTHIQLVSNSLVQQFSTNENGILFDIDDFVTQASSNTTHYDEFNASLSHSVVYKSSTDFFLDNLQLNKFSGISIFIPDTSNILYHDFYKNFAWYQDTRYCNYFNKFGFGN